MKKLAWYGSIPLIIFTASLAGCFSSSVIKGNGDITSEPRNVTTFDDLSIHGN